MIKDDKMPLDKQQIIGVLFIDHSKTFDIISHSLRLDKLVHYKPSKRQINPMNSYLSNCFLKRQDR